MQTRTRSIVLLAGAAVLALGVAASRGATLAFAEPRTSEPTRRAEPPKSPLLDLLPARTSFDGRVAERLGAGPYCYLRVVTDTTERWVVVLGKGAEPGALVHVRSFGSRTAFHSPRLARDFDVLYFALVDTSPSPVAIKEHP